MTHNCQDRLGLHANGKVVCGVGKEGYYWKTILMGKQVRIKVGSEEKTFSYRMTNSRVVFVAEEILIQVPNTNDVPEVMRKLGAATGAVEVRIEKNLLGLKINMPKGGWPTPPTVSAASGSVKQKPGLIMRRPGFAPPQHARA